MRDHWEEVTGRPWWASYVMDQDERIEATRQLQAMTGEDRVRLRLGWQRDDRGHYTVEPADSGDEDEMRLVDSRTEEARVIRRPRPEVPSARNELLSVSRQITSREQIDEFLPLRQIHTADELAADGRDEFPRRIVAELGSDYLPWAQLPAPFDPLPYCWGFENFMIACVERRDLVHYAAEQVVAHTRRRVDLWKALGAELIWVEDGLTDQMSPDFYASLVLPHLQDLIAYIRDAGMYSIHYYCGEPNDRLDVLMASGADALSLEDSKKGYTIDIVDIAEKVDGRIALLGNMDAWAVMERGSMERIRAEVARQLEAGRRNSGRFLMGYGSPITPDTPAARCRAVADMVHEMAP